MESGTRRKSLLQDHCGSADEFGGILITLGTADVWSGPATSPFFIWRSGDDVADGGHMVVPSIGQAISSSTNSVTPSATERSDNAHIAPITWQKANTSTNAMCFGSARRIMQPTTPSSLAILSLKLEPISKLKNDSPKDAPPAKAETSSAIFPRILQFIHGACDMPKLFPRR
jgi:hypothetical protein